MMLDGWGSGAGRLHRGPGFVTLLPLRPRPRDFTSPVKGAAAGLLPVTLNPTVSLRQQGAAEAVIFQFEAEILQFPPAVHP